MSQNKTRVVHDSMGEMNIPQDALYGAQTQRAVNNFPISGLTMPREFIRALGLIKQSAAKANAQLGLLDKSIAQAIIKAAEQIINGDVDHQFPVDVFQTGSGTSSNMNCNEVLATLASRQSGIEIHPNDHVNFGQSSNDVIPTAIHISATLAIHTNLLPALDQLVSTLNTKAKAFKGVVKTGRTHLMDAMPLGLDQELSGWVVQLEQNKARLQSTLNRLTALAQGGTAIGTGINAAPEFAKIFTTELSQVTGVTFTPAKNFFEAIASQDTAVEVSGQLRVLAVSLMKIANDLRWMNSGPLTGLAEITLPAIQPGSSIMPGKVNPVIPEALCMLCAQVIGNDTTVTVAGQSGNFQLNVMLPVIGYNLLQSIGLLSNGMRVLAEKALAETKVNAKNLETKLAINPILVTALNPLVGYEIGAKIAKRVYETREPVIDVALALTDLDRETLERVLNPTELTKGGFPK